MHKNGNTYRRHYRSKSDKKHLTYKLSYFDQFFSKFLLIIAQKITSMEKLTISTEQKAALKTVFKYIEKVNPNTPYQQKIKRDIQHIINVLEVEDLESWITCNKFISANYGYILTRNGFSPLTEETIRQYGVLWNYNNLTSIAETLQQELNTESFRSSVTEGVTEYAAEKIVGWLLGR